MKTAIEQTYISLLADVASLSGFSEIRGSYEGLQWTVFDAPKLEKYLLSTIKKGVEPDLLMFPKWLRRLVSASVVDPQKLRYLRQLLLFSYKASITHDTKTTETSFDTFVEVNRAVGLDGNNLANASPSLLNSARAHCHSVLYRFRPKEVIPSHGPGASTTSKDVWSQRYQTVDSLYPYSDWFYLYQNRDHLGQYESINDAEHIEAKLIAVPKDSRGPRLICVHPAESIWIQQGLRRELERSMALTRNSNGPWPKNHVHFDDQTVNGKIALLSSRSGRYATIDMKEASDRISEPLVQALFGRYYKWFGCCRAQKVRVPAYAGNPERVLDISSYAPMGNATTFPVQSLVFWSICVSSLQRHGFHQPGAVFVFGDDIIVPSEAADRKSVV